MSLLYMMLISKVLILFCRDMIKTGQSRLLGYSSMQRLNQMNSNMLTKRVSHILPLLLIMLLSVRHLLLNTAAGLVKLTLP
jgi:hypothetical protein